jgi:2-C-methyl-D-erythritol 4-phosphate cytidylyltransferase
MPRYWAVIPAAGAGVRMGQGTPKQYLELRGRAILAHAIERLLSEPRIQAVMVALAAADTRWPALGYAGNPRVMTTTGGRERCHSVLNGLKALLKAAQADDWVLVHDAARPCVPPADIGRLIEAAASHPCGGLLAIPVRDTMKRADSTGSIQETVDRDGLWHAMTPQMFRLGALEQAVASAVAGGSVVTDEAQAIERQGGRPLLVSGSPDNIKITRTEDLQLAEHYLSRQEQAR